MKNKTAKFIKKTSYILCAASWIFLLSLTVQAQNLHQWGNISLFNGLPSDKVYAITQTPNGIFWFGTENGLAKFDGRRVQTVPLEKVTQVLSLAVSKDGSLFVGTNNGAFHFANDAFSLISETNGKRINAISINEKILFGTQNGEILELNNSEAQIVAKIDVPVTSIAAKNEDVFFGTEGRGVFKLENGEAKEIKTSIRPYFIQDLAFNNDGSIWIGSQTKSIDSGLFGYLPNTRFAKFGDQLGTINAIYSGYENEIWVGTKDRGIYLFQGGNEISHFTFENTSGGLRSNQILDIFTDREGVVWVGTDKGICRFDAKGPFNYLFSENPESNFVRSLFQTNDSKIYAGTNKGLYSFDGKLWSADTNFTNRSVYSVGETATNELVIGTPINNIRSVQLLNGKTYSAVFGKGFYENDELIFSHTAIISMFSDDKKIYLGTVKDGIFEFSNGKVTSLNLLTDNAIRKISGSDETGFWFATEKGLFYWKASELTAIIENIDFRSLYVKDGNIFAGSNNKGLFQAKFNDEFGWMFSNLNVEQGLLSSGIFSILPYENSLLIGTGKGVTKYGPNNIPAEIVPNRIISERVHSIQEISGNINIDYPQNSLSVEVIGLSSRTFPESFQYGYLLKNSKGETVLKRLTKDSQISFENLSPDDYSVEIVAFNQDLVSSNPLKFTFSVGKAPFPWTSTALAILLLIALLALVWAIIEQREIVKKNKEIAAARFDLANEAERERRRIARDLHDQTLADLRNLMLKSDEIEGENSEFRHEIESVSDEIRRICEDLSPSVLENVGLMAALEFLLSKTVEKYDFTYSEGLEDRLNFSSNVQMQIYRIAQEVLNNIKRHAQAKFVEMNVSDEENFKLIIKNDGKPFSPDFENLPKGRGITNIKSRSELIEAEITWNIDEENKTVFVLNKKIN